MGNWWLAASSWQHAHSYITSSAEFFGKTSNRPGDSVPLQPRLGALQLLAFTNWFQIMYEIQKNTTGQLMEIGRIVWGPKVPSLKETEVFLSYVQRFLYLVLSSINVCIFHIVWMDTFWTDLIYTCICTCLYMHVDMCVHTCNSKLCIHAPIPGRWADFREVGLYS